MKKILVLGCSFSRGSYKEYEWPDDDDYKGPVEKRDDIYIKDSKGWWYFVNYFDDKDITVIACPGQGYWAYYQIILFLNENKKLNYDEIWIQETTEPRCTLNSWQYINKSRIFNVTHFDNSFDLIQIKYANDDDSNSFSLYQNDESTLSDTIKPFKENRTFFKNLTKSCSYYIDEFCKEKNIKGYVWSMFNPIMKHNFFERLTLTFMMQELKEKNLLVQGPNKNGHQTEEGNKYIAKQIDKEIYNGLG